VGPAALTDIGSKEGFGAPDRSLRPLPRAGTAT